VCTLQNTKYSFSYDNMSSMRERGYTTRDDPDLFSWCVDRQGLLDVCMSSARGLVTFYRERER